MTGQGVIGRDCAWCGLPATCVVEVQPAQYRTVSRRDPVTGKRTARQVFERAAIVVAVCDTHQQVTVRQPAPVPIPRQRTARGIQQLDMFASASDTGTR